MRSVKSFLLYIVCGVSIAVVNIGQSQAACGSLLSELTVKRVASRIIASNQMLLQRRFYSSNISHTQVYGVTTYDALFKYVLSDENLQ